MEKLQNISSDKLNKVYETLFSLNYLGKDISDKFAIISLTCYLTNELRKKGKKVTCYQLLLSIAKSEPDTFKNTFLKSLGAICEDFLYGCEVFPTFNLSQPNMVKTIQKILSNYCPF